MEQVIPKHKFEKFVLHANGWTGFYIMGNEADYPIGSHVKLLTCCGVVVGHFEDEEYGWTTALEKSDDCAH